MGIKTKEFNKTKYEILEHAEVPGFRKAFYMIFAAASLYLLYIFSKAL